jgi:hypothetical protein
MLYGSGTYGSGTYSTTAPAVGGGMLYGSGTYGSGTYATTVSGVGGVFASVGLATTATGNRDAWIVGSVIPLAWTITDRWGDPADPTTVTLTATLAGGVPETLTTTSPRTGEILAAYRPMAPGPYVFRLVLDGDYATAVEDRALVTAVDSHDLTVVQMRAYLGDTSADDAELAGAILAERHAQAARCRIDRYGPDLLEALKRRVARNLAARRVPVASFTAFDGGSTSTRVPTQDPEIRRLEAPYRRISVG